MKFGAFGVTENLEIVDIPSVNTVFPPDAKFFSEEALVWTIHCTYSAKVEQVAKEKGWKIDYSRHEEESRLIREAEEKARLEAEEKRKAEEKARLELEARRKAEEERRKEIARKAEEERKAREAKIAEERRLAEEAKRREEARLAEERRLKKEKQLKTFKKALIIFAVSVVSLLALVIVLATVVFPNNTYNNAEKLFAEGKYEKAEVLYASLGNHKDSATKLAVTQSIGKIEDGKYGDAIETLLEQGVCVKVS